MLFHLSHHVLIFDGELNVMDCSNLLFPTQTARQMLPYPANFVTNNRLFEID